MNRFKQSDAPTVAYEGEKDTLHFDVSAKLVTRAEVPAPKGADWKAQADRWLVTVTQREYGNAIDLDFWTGYGLRAFPAGPRTGTVDFYALSVPVAPSAIDVLGSLGLDLSSLRDLPNEDGAALDQLAEDSGFTKPSEALAVLAGLRAAADKVAKLVANTGMSPADFADWASELDR